MNKDIFLESHTSENTQCGKKCGEIKTNRNRFTKIRYCSVNT
jgi:hypothetical protein